MKCTNCGAELAPEDRFCGECGVPRPQLPPRFAEAVRRFAPLRARYQAGELDDAAYDVELQKLVVEDDTGGYWMLGADSGAWYWYDGEQWVRRDPPLAAASVERPQAGPVPLPAVAPPTPARKGFPWKWIAVGCGGLLVVAIIVGVLVVPRLFLPVSTPLEPTVVAPAASTTVPTATPLPTATPTVATVAPTHTPTTRPTTTPTRTPKSTPSPTPSRVASATPTATLTPTSAPSTSQPTSPPASGALITFEQWTTWRRGDQPYGELTQTEEQVRSGRYAAELRYDFPVTDEDFVVFLHPLSLAGQPDTLGAWVYGDGSGHYLNVWIQDAQNENWCVHLGQVGDAGWRQMVGTLDPNLPWPSGHVSGPENGVIDYPVRFYALVLDRPGSGPQSGQIYIDEISVWRNQASATITPVAGQATPTATAGAPVSAGPLNFSEPTQLDAWESADGGYRATIIVHISGGAPPFTIYHDLERFETEERDYSLVFTFSGCVIVKTIAVESADGQSVSHDYWIRAPWCD